VCSALPSYRVNPYPITREFESLLGKREGLELRRQLRTRSPDVIEMGYSALTPPEPFDRLPTIECLARPLAIPV